MPEKYIDLAADALIFSPNGDELQLLLIQRKDEPCKGMWAFPGGFINYGEEPEAAAIRELKEETGVTIDAMKQLHTFGRPDRDPRGHTVSVVHYAYADAKHNFPTPGDDAAAARWTNVREIGPLAFDHNEILEYALKTLKLGPFDSKWAID